MKEIFNEIVSIVKEFLSIVHYVSILTFVAGLAAVAGSYEETVNYTLKEWIIPSILTSFVTGLLMELIRTRFPSIYRIFKRAMS